MDGVSRYSSWLRSARSPGVLLVALIVLLGVGGYLLTSTTIRDDRDDAAARRAQVEAVHAQEVLGRARAYVGGLAEVLAGEPEPGQAEFERWAGATSASVGLNDVLWVERVPASERGRYERLRGVPITRPTASGRGVPAPPAGSYLPATFTSQTRPELRPGVDVTGFPGLGAAIRDRARIFAVGASRPGALGTEPGFYLLQAATFAHGSGSRGYLVAFVPRGWFSTTLGGDPRRVAISEDGKTIEGALESVQASAGFEMLGRNWRIDVAREPPSGLQSLLPWIALAWPFAVAGVALVIGRAISQRRRAQREVERIFEMSLDMICIGGFDGSFKAVNPAFERTLGYSTGELLARPFLDFVHPDDRQRTSDVFAHVLSGHAVTQFENRYICKDGSERWLQWSSRSIPDQKVVYAIARDVTESRRIAGEQAALRRVATLVAQAVSLEEVFTAVTQEAGTLLGGDFAGLARFDGDDVVPVGVWAASGSHPPTPASWPMEDGDPATTVAERGEAVRWDSWKDVPGAIAAFIRELGVRSTVGCPIYVGGELWGALAVHSTRDVPLPADADRRIDQFNDLVAMAIVNARARAEVARLAEEQAALRRVATLVARGAPQAEVFSAIADSVGELSGTEDISMTRYEGDTRVILASSGRFREAFPVGSRQALKGENAATRVLRTGQPVRIDEYDTATGPIAERARSIGIQSVVATPIVVEGRLWGALTIATATGRTLPAETEERLGQFTELMATAIANTESRATAERLADEQAALRRVATLVAEGHSPAEVLNKVTVELANVVEGADCVMFRDEGDGTATVLAVSGRTLVEGSPVGTRLPVDGTGVIATVLREGRSARMDGEPASGAIAERGRELGIRSAVGCPVLVHGRVWGALGAAAFEPGGLPLEAERRIGQFADLVSTAIANADARSNVERLADEQTALRRVATLVAEGVAPAELFSAVTREAARLFRGAEPLLVPSIIRFDPGPEFVLVGTAEPMLDLPIGSRWEPKELYVSTRVQRTERSARVDEADLDEHPGPDAELLRRQGFLHQVGSPIVVEGRLWGAMTMNSANEMPADTAARLESFTELVATAIANAESGEALAELADEQASLRRVATLVAEGVEPSELFTAVTREVAHLFADGDPSLVPSVIRFDPGPEFVLVGAAREGLERDVGSRYGPTELFVSTRVLRTGASARVDEEELDEIGGRDAELLRREGFLHQVGSPIVVEGRPWGAITINSASPLPPDAGDRLENFTELVATAIANTESREGLRKLADEQAALRRIATLVAEARPPAEVLDAVTGEMEALLGADQVALNRFEPGDEIVVLAHRGLDVERTPVGSRVSTAGESVTATVRRTGRPARIESYESAEGAIAQLARETGLRSSVSAPIMVEARPWGVITASWKRHGSPPPDTEHRMVQFAALLDSAIANTEARTEIERLAEEQAALRRVATLVAEGAPARSIFDAVAAEMGRVLGADGVTLNRYEAGDEVSVLAHSGSDPQRVPLGTRVRHRGENVTTMVRRSKRPARMEHREGTHSPIVSHLRGSGVRASVGAPITVEGRLWGVAIANWSGEQSAPPDTEIRMAQFAGLLDTAIANADGRDQLAASRARLVTASDEARRRLVRDLHDGAQQRLVHTIVTLKLAQRAFTQPDGKAQALVGEALQYAERSNAELRELAHGILPAVLTRGGLRSGITAVVSRLDLPVRVDVAPERFPADIEASAYFIVAEALTNVVKHSHATRAEVRASLDDGRLHVEVQDDGIGGADPGGHGLVGMADRVTALGGQLTVESPPGNGTLVVATLPLASA